MGDITESKTIHPMVEMAMAKSEINVDSLEKLLDVQKAWEENESKKLFNIAFTEMQSEIPEIPKTQEGHNCLFSPLENTIKYVRPLFEKYGFSFRHEVSQDKTEISVACILSHKNGHSESSTMKSLPDDSGGKNDIQAIGSARTYLKRYTFEDVIGIVTGNNFDDDAVSVSVEYISESKIAYLQSLINQYAVDKSGFLKFCKIDSLEKMPMNKYAQACAKLKAKYENN